MAGTDRCSLLQDDRGVSVIFGTLMLILITIIAASSVAYMVAATQENYMERQTQVRAVENEELRIISIDPSGNSTHWNTINFTVLNLNTDDSHISGIKLNDIFALNYMANGEQSQIDMYKTYPVIYNFNRRVQIPATQSKEICLNMTDIEVIRTESFDVSYWANRTLDHTVTLSDHPGTVYSGFSFSEEVSNSSQTFSSSDYSMDHTTGELTLDASGSLNPCVTTVVDVSGWANNADNFTFSFSASPVMSTFAQLSNATINGFTPSNNYSVNYTAGDITLIGTAHGGNLSNATNYDLTYKRSDTAYNITYTVNADSFTRSIAIQKGEPVVIELMTSHVNLFKENFAPPEPLAEVQFESERRIENSTVTYDDYLLLDGSASFDTDGFITSYKWAVWDNNTLIYDYNLTGMKTRPTKLDLSTASNVKIDLEVVDDNGMVSRLSQKSGNISIM